MLKYSIFKFLIFNPTGISFVISSEIKCPASPKAWNEIWCQAFIWSNTFLFISHETMRTVGVVANSCNSPSYLWIKFEIFFSSTKCNEYGPYICGLDTCCFYYSWTREISAKSHITRYLHYQTWTGLVKKG